MCRYYWVGIVCEDLWTNIEYQTAFDLEVALNNKLYTMTCSINISQPLSSAIPIWHNGLMHRVATVAVIEAWTQKQSLLLMKVNLTTAAATNTETNTEPLIWHYTSRRPCSSLVLRWLHLEINKVHCSGISLQSTLKFNLIWRKIFIY